MKNKINLFAEGKISRDKMLEIFQGWNAYAKWANSFNKRIEIAKEIRKIISKV